MIRVGIAGADTAMAGELIRVLINHPDIELTSAFAPGKVGRKVASVHHGLSGECDIDFSPDINPAKLDVIFIDAHSDVADRFRMNTDRWPDLRIIDMSHCPSLDFEALGQRLQEGRRTQIGRRRRHNRALPAGTPSSPEGRYHGGLCVSQRYRH